MRSLQCTSTHLIVIRTVKSPCVEGQLREANSARAAFESAKARMEQEAALMQQHNDWLRAELTKKSEELLGARKVGPGPAIRWEEHVHRIPWTLRAASWDAIYK